MLYRIQVARFPPMDAGFARPTLQAMAVHLHVDAAHARSRDPAGEASTIAVVLIDEHLVCRRNVRRLLDCEAGVEVIAEAPDAAAVLVHLSVRAPHVLVLDPGTAGGAGIDAIRLLRSELPETGILVLTMDDCAAFAERALGAGATGFVLKHKADEELPTAVRRAARGLTYVSPRVAPRLRRSLI